MNLEFRVLDSVDSTNEELKRLPPAEAVEGFWLRAVRQTAGKGRQGRIWNSDAGNFHASTIVVPRPGDPPLQTLAFVAALAVHSLVVAKLGDAPELSIKWPNDVMWDGAKLAGILLERHGERVIVGIGINLRHAPQIPGRATAALADIGIALAPGEALADLAQLFGSWLSVWRGSLGDVLDAWRDAAHPPGTRLAVHGGTESRIEGVFEGVAQDGALLLRLDDGTRQAIHSGDVGLL